MASCISIEKAVNLLSQHNKGYIWIDGSVLKLGIQPFHEEYSLDFAAETLLGTKVASVAVPAAVSAANQSPRARLLQHGGKYLYRIKGEIVVCDSYKEILKKGILAIEQYYPGLLPELAKRKGRTRRIVATKAADLFRNPDLANKYAEQLKPGWFYGTNNNATTTRDWLKEACDTAGLKWGEDFEVSI